MPWKHVKTVLFLLLFAVPTVVLWAQAKKTTDQSQRAVYRERSAWAGISSELLLSQIDTDRDGVITREEWDRYFRERDENKDDRLTAEEILGGQKVKEDETQNPDAGREAAFRRLDVNKNDQIERSEWPGNDRSFKHMDANRDGVVSLEEFMSRNGRYWNEKFENLDFNRNGIITRDEWMDSEIAFQRLDHDHNGVIERREFYNPR